MSRRSLSLWVSAACACLALAAASCRPASGEPVTPTPDYALLETRTEERLAARLTAQAPAPTETPTPTQAPPTATPLPTTPSPTATPTPGATVSPPVLVFVQKGQNDTTNIIAPSIGAEEEGVLTHFPEPLSIDALVWSKEGDWLALASSHDFIHSRRNERNIFFLRPDGSELRMVTGEYLDPAQAPGPYVTLEGTIAGAQGICRVIAQGAVSPVETNEEQGYAFALTGVPLEATWARAVCQDEAVTLQGDVDLALQEETPPISIPVSAQGQGWRDLALAPGSQRIVGTFYQWEMDEEGERRYQVRGAIYDVATNETTWLEIPEGMDFYGADWSFDGARIIGGLADEEAAYLWEWDTQGQSVGAMLTLENPEDEFLTIVRPRCSPQETGIVFELHRWYWWADPKFRTDLMLLEPGQEEPVPLVVAEWGQHATHPAWAATGAVVFYQNHAQEGDLGSGLPPYSDIWSVSIEEPTPAPWTEDGVSYLPAVRPSRELP